MFYKIIMIATFLFLTNCTTIKNHFSPDKEEQVVTSKTPLKQAIKISIKTGNKNLNITKKIIKKYKAHYQAASLLTSLTLQNYQTWNKQELINAINLLQFSSPNQKQIQTIFQKLVESEEIVKQKMAWILASNFSSTVMAQNVESFLTQAIKNNEIEIQMGK